MSTLSVLYSFYISLTKSLLSLAFARLYIPQHVTERDLTGQTAIVTGANSGIGLHIAIALAKQGATVHLACRNADRGAAAAAHIIAKCDDKNKERITCQILDVGDLTSIRNFCLKWKQGGATIDMLVHNAGIAALPAGSPMKTADGLEMIYTTNFLGSFLMTHLLEANLSTTARIVLTSSTGSYSGAAHFLRDAPPVVKNSAPGIIARLITKGKAMLGLEEESSSPAYGLSKAQQVLFAALLQRHFDAQAHESDGERTYRTAHAFTPGFTSTPIFRKFDVTWQTWITNPLFAVLKTTEAWVAVDTGEGAKTGAWLATWGEEIGRKKQGGGFWERMEQRTNFVDLMEVKRQTEEWRTWERDAGIFWSG